jgi:carbamoyl-phosphate synthase large subunit
MPVVLISSAGRRVGLIRCFRQAAESLGVPLQVLATDANPTMSAACQCADRSFQVPPCADSAFIPALLDLCQAQKVNLIIPTIDPELPPLSASRSRFAEAGVRVAVSSPEVVRMARNKLNTSQFLTANKIPAVRTAPLRELLDHPSAWAWPVVLKPLAGSASVGLHVAHGLRLVESLPIDHASYVVQEHRSGNEYTVQMFFDAGGRLRCAVPYRRCEVRAGEVSKAITCRQPALMAIAERLGGALAGAAGVLGFQAFVAPSGEASVFEINARFCGGYPLVHAAGGHYAKWLLEETLDRPLSAHDQWVENLVMLRYDDAFFVSAASPASSS